MLDWTQFHAAIVAGTAPFEIANAGARAWAWLDLSPDDRQVRIAESVQTEPSARWMVPALDLVIARIWREAGVELGDQAALDVFFDRLNRGAGSHGDLDTLRRADAARTMRAFVIDRFPAAAPAEATPDLAILNDHVTSLSEALQRLAAVAPSPEALAELRQAIDLFEPIAASFADRARRDHAWWLGMAWSAAGRASFELGRHADTRDAFERAAGHYDRAGDAKSAADCRQYLETMNRRLRGDFDTAAETAIQEVLSADDPLARVGSLIALSRDIWRTGDVFETARVAEQAAQLLWSLGYPDPEAAFDVAVQQWLATAAASLTGNDLFARLSAITVHWVAVLAARTSVRLTSDPLGSERAERGSRRLSRFADELSREAESATRTAQERFAVWNPAYAAASPEGAHDASARTMEALRELEMAMHALRTACNEGASEAQLTRAAELREQAARLGSRLHLASACVEQAYVLDALGRHDEVSAAAGAAIETLRGDRPASLGAFATGAEREVYLQAVTQKARALAARKDHAGILALCEPLVREIEYERRQVNSPYQQSAFLATRVELYELLAVAAYRTSQLDLLLAIMELLKARGALRSRLVPDADGEALDVDAAIRHVQEAILTTEPGSDEEERLRERRRWLSTVAAIARARASGAIPDVSIAALQAAVEPDEAVISWFLLGTHHALVLAASREQVRTALVDLGTGAPELPAFIDCVLGLSADRPRYDRLIPRINELVATLGDALLPRDVRDLIATKSRLALSPHRSLHLFPFHAVPWLRDGVTAPVMAHCAVRYVPNLTSLLLPWRGRTEGPVLAAGVGRFDDPGIPPLENAEGEAAGVAGVHGALGRAIVNPTRRDFAALPLSEYRCLHIATHGSSVLSGDALDDPLQACLHLRDGALTGWELTALALRAELVVLAACHSGQRSIAGRGLERLPGDDIFGLQAVLFEAGVGSVLGTLWPVDDATARELLLAFHGAYAAGARPDAALQAAVRAHIDAAVGRQDVFYWAPFFVSALGRPA